jgi:hypothetical protein
VQSYFEYRFMSMCGIPTVTLEGTVEDWERIRERVARLARYELTWWTGKIEPILDEFVKAAKGRPTVTFWQDVYKEQFGSGGPYLSGWLVWLLPYLKQRDYDHKTHRLTPWRTDQPNAMLGRPFSARREMYGLTHDRLPSSVSSVPFTWQYLGQNFDYQFLAGVMAVTQDAASLAIRPRVGWAVRPTPTSAPKSVWDRE